MNDDVEEVESEPVDGIPITTLGEAVERAAQDMLTTALSLASDPATFLESRVIRVLGLMLLVQAETAKMVGVNLSHKPTQEQAERAREIADQIIQTAAQTAQGNVGEA